MINIVDNIPLARSIVNQLYLYNFINRYEKEDLMQIAYIELIKAAKKFDESKGLKFSTYAFPFIKYGLLRYANSDKNYNIRRDEPHHYKMHSIDVVFDSTGEKPTPAEDILNTGNEFENELINSIDLKAAIASLDNEEREIIKLYYFDDLNQIEIADLLNTSQVQVSRRLKKALKMMGKYLRN